MTANKPSGTVLLATMALIKANADAGRTHLDNFTPFVLEVMRPDPDKWFQPHEVADEVSDIMGLVLPARVAEAVLKRAARKHVVVRDQRQYRLADGVADRLPNLRSKQASFMRDQEALTEKLTGFAKRVHGLDLDREDAAAALYAQIETDVVDLLRVDVQATAYRRRESAADCAYVVSDFIAEAARADPAGYEAILAAAKGTMLAAAIQIPNLERIDSKFVNTTLYLDAPLLLQLVGLEGPESEMAVKEILRVARTAGARVGCFEHSVDEAEGVIRGNAEARRRPSKVPSRVTGIQAWAIRADMDYHDLLIESEKFRSRLAQQCVAIIERPDHNARIEVSEDDLREELEAAIAYRAGEPLLRDLDSLVAIHNLRGGSSSAQIETCRAVLVTDNEAVARVARTFFSSERHQWPVATSMSDLATILYLKAPQQASTLPALLLLAEAYAGLEPGSALWTKFLTIVEGQEAKGEVTAEDIALLCHSGESRRLLMETTLGRPDKVTNESVAEILNRAKELAAKPAQEIAATAVADMEAAESDRDAAEARFREAEAGIQRLSSEVQSALSDAKAAHDWARGVEENLHDNAVQRADSWIKWIAALVGLALIVASVGSFAGPWPDGHLGLVLRVLAAAGGVLGLITATMGGNLVAWLSFVRVPLAQRIEMRARLSAGLPATPLQAAAKADHTCLAALRPTEDDLRV